MKKDHKLIKQMRERMIICIYDFHFCRLFLICRLDGNSRVALMAIGIVGDRSFNNGGIRSYMMGKWSGEIGLLLKQDTKHYMPLQLLSTHTLTT